MTTPRQTWAVIDAATEPGGLLAAAGQLSTEVVALVIGPRAVAEQVSAFGPAETRWLGEPAAGGSLEDYAVAVAKMAEQDAPVAILVTAATRTRLFAGRLAARLDTAALTDVVEVHTDGDRIIVTHPMYGGAAARVEKVLSPTAVITVSATASGSPRAVPTAPGPLVDAECPADRPPLTVLARRPEPRSPGELTAAKIVVGAGRGVSRRENLALVEDLAGALGGQVACTRPVAEGLNWMARDRYLGVSGLEISPDLYVAVGISGQIQHMIGVDRARVIVAINNDRAAPVFSQADYAIVGDLEEVVPALIDALRAAP